MSPQEFVSKWAGTPLGEQQIAQAHFLDVCRLVGVELPAAGLTEAGERFVFEPLLKKSGGGHGFADVYYENHFAIEYKSPDKYKDLRAAYQQLLQYRIALKNPPLLIVTDINTWEIHTNFPNSAEKVYRFQHSEIASNPEARGWLEAMFHAPQRLHPDRNTEQVTKEAAASFKTIADNMRDWGEAPQRIAYFLTKLVFCLFAEDIGLLPSLRGSGTGIFSDAIRQSKGKPAVFRRHLQNLFLEMNRGGTFFGEDIRYFNGTLFNVVTVEALSPEAIASLEEAAKLDWAAIEPSIFGTLFERSLDPSKRAQLGAHYTAREDILLIIEPVLMQPLRYHWDTAQLEAAPLRERYDQAQTGRARANAEKALLALRDGMLRRIRETKVLDPACGSGNFLYVALQRLMELEQEVIQHPLWAGFTLPLPAVHPRQLYGIEINPIAQALASIVVWIGYIQWRANNGYRGHFKEPILEELAGNIVCRDAILPPLHPHPKSLHIIGGSSSSGSSGGGLGVGEVMWPAVDVIVGNPPFLGDKLMRGELGDDYVDQLREHYRGRVPGGADLVTYWFEVARVQIDKGRAKRAGLLATNSIRIGTNRAVLSRIKASGDIFMAWSDREWPLDGANVRVSMIGFDKGSEKNKTLDGNAVEQIYSDLTASVDVADASPLKENDSLSFLGVLKTGPFDIPENVALSMLSNSSNNSAVIKPRLNGRDIVNVPSNTWIIDFLDMNEDEAAQYNEPYGYVKSVVKPVRDRNKVRKLRDRWWQHARPRYAMRQATQHLNRFIATPEVTKHRIFVWVSKEVVPDHTLHVIARDDDYFFGVLHSSIHVLWAIRMGSTLGSASRYNSSRTFKTFPFPWAPGQEDHAHPAYARISAAAKQLDAERSAWLGAAPHKDHTLTNLYNALQVFRGAARMRTKPAAADFAPRLDFLHHALDAAVCAAYGWEAAVLADEEEIVRRLLALNRARA